MCNIYLGGKSKKSNQKRLWQIMRLTSSTQVRRTGKTLIRWRTFWKTHFATVTLTGRKTVSRASFRQNGTIPKKR